MRVSASTAAKALEHLGFPPIRPGTLRHWRYLGRLSPGPGYDPAEIADVLVERVDGLPSSQVIGTVTV